MAFSILNHIREGSTADNTKPNDDWLAFNDKIAVVADGATGLGDYRLVQSDDSDAQWIAKLGVKRFMNGSVDDPVRDLVREVNEHAASVIAKEHMLEEIPKYAWPSSGFIMARDQGALVEISSLGDCVAFVEMADGYIERFSALAYNRSTESQSAKRDLAMRTGNSEGIRTPEIVEALRRKRELSNTAQSGVWTLGLSAEAAEHVLSVALPKTDVKTILLMSDGFSAACDAYEICDERELIKRARASGLADIQTEIRRIERIVDPSAKQFPRYKQSDDSSAILFEIGK